MDYGSQKMEELIGKIDRMSVEEFNTLCERAEKDLHILSASSDQVPDNEHEIISVGGVPVRHTDMLFTAPTYVPYSVALGQHQSWLTSPLEPLIACADNYDISLSMLTEPHVTKVSGLTTHFEIESEYSYDASVAGLGRAICNSDSFSYQLNAGKTEGDSSSEQEEGDAWAIAA